jgi:hypothetical protein
VADLLFVKPLRLLKDYHYAGMCCVICVSRHLLRHHQQALAPCGAMQIPLPRTLVYFCSWKARDTSGCLFGSCQQCRRPGVHLRGGSEQGGRHWRHQLPLLHQRSLVRRGSGSISDALHSSSSSSRPYATALEQLGPKTASTSGEAEDVTGRLLCLGALLHRLVAAQMHAVIATEEYRMHSHYTA